MADNIRPFAFAHIAGRDSTARSLSFRACILFLILILKTGAISGQINQNAGSYADNDLDKAVPSPAKAAMLSATLPGLGQIYNGKYWKLPIIYGGFGTLVYFVDFNSSEYRKWREAWVARVDGNPNTIDDFPLHSTDVLERAMNYYRRNLEITYMLAAALYLLNILDASVDAHLMHFDVGEELSLGMQACTMPNGRHAGPAGYRPQITLRFRF